MQLNQSRKSIKNYVKKLLKKKYVVCLKSMNVYYSKNISTHIPLINFSISINLVFKHNFLFINLTIINTE